MHSLHFTQNNPDALLIFLHLLKTGGTSFNFLLKQNYINGYKRIEGEPPIELRELVLKDELKNYKVISGHFSLFDPSYQEINFPFNHIIILREPIERILSAYYYAQKTREHPFCQEARSFTLLDLFKTNRASLLGLDNYQIRQLSSFQSWKDLEIAKDQAIHYLQSGFTLFGFTDQLNDLVLLCRDKFNWKFADLPILNVNHTYSTQKNLDVEELEYIRNINKYEIEFYDFAKNLYEQRYRDRLNFLKTKAK